MLKPLERMWARVENEKADSDTAFFFGLLNLGELVLKLCVAGMVAAIQDDKSRIRYGHEHSLVRANGIGDWARTLDEVRPAAQIILPEARIEQRALTERLRSGLGLTGSAALRLMARARHAHGNDNQDRTNPEAASLYCARLGRRASPRVWIPRIPTNNSSFERSICGRRESRTQ